MDIKFEGASFNAEGIAKYKDSKEFIGKRKHQFFVDDPEQEAKMTHVYELCREAVGNPVVAEQAEESETEATPAPSKPPRERNRGASK